MKPYGTGIFPPPADTIQTQEYTMEKTLLLNGYAFDFELMSDDERAEALSDAGYDIDDFDF